MKKIVPILLTIASLILISTSASAATIYIALDNTLDFDLLAGVDIFTTLEDNASVELSVYSDGTEAIPAWDYKGLGVLNVAYAEWSTTYYGALIELTEKPTALADDDTAPEEMPFSAGLLCSLTTSEEFSIDKVSLLAVTEDGFYSGNYQLSPGVSYEDGILYKVSSVPVPSSLLLLSGGILTLLGINRRKKK